MKKLILLGIPKKVDKVKNSVFGLCFIYCAV